MKTGTKSLLFGVHQFIWHPITVTLAWVALYKRFPNLKELFCIVIHDWGYWGSECMDDEKGQEHPVWAAELMLKWRWYYCAHLCLFHSRHYAKKHGLTPSKLCWADKLSLAYDPCRFYLLRARLSGELKEYRTNSAACGFFPIEGSNKAWFRKMRAFMRDQATEMKSNELYMKT